MSNFESSDTIARHYDSLSTADILAFDGWQENHRRIARAVVKHELAEGGPDQEEIDQAREDGEEDGKLKADAVADAAYLAVTEIHAEIANQVRALRTKLPPELDKACEDILAQIADLPDTL